MNGRITQTRRLDADGEWILTAHFYLDGEEVTEAAYRAAIPEKSGVPMFATAISDSKPWMSDALAVHKTQISEVKERNRRKGLNINYTPDGRPICTDAGQRKALCKIEGVRQVGKRGSYYGY